MITKYIDVVKLCLLSYNMGALKKECGLNMVLYPNITTTYLPDYSNCELNKMLYPSKSSIYLPNCTKCELYTPDNECVVNRDIPVR